MVNEQDMKKIVGDVQLELSELQKIGIRVTKTKKDESNIRRFFSDCKSPLGSRELSELVDCYLMC